MSKLAYLVTSRFATAPRRAATRTAMLQEREVDGGAVGVILILLTIGCVLTVFFFVVCIKQAQARRREKRGRRGGFSRRRGDVPLSQRTYRSHTRNTPEPVGLGISDLGLDLEAGPKLPAPTPPPSSYHTNSLRSQRSECIGASRHQGLAGRTMRSGTARSHRPRPSQSIHQYLQSQVAARNARDATIPTAAEDHGSQRRGFAGSRDSWER